MKFWLTTLLIVCLSVAASASTDIVGRIGKNSGGFTGRFSISGGFGKGSTPPTGCTSGTIDLSSGCAQPMLGGL